MPSFSTEHLPASRSRLEKKPDPRMLNSSQEHAISIPFRSVAGKHSLHAYARTLKYGTSQLKQKGAESTIGLMNKFRRKADNLAQGIRDHVSLGPGVSETVKAKLKLGTRILQAGGIERVFKKSFAIGEGEKLVKAFQCHLSTTVGPIPGLLFISTEKIAFLSDRSLVIQSPKGNIARIPCVISCISPISVKTNSLDLLLLLPPCMPPYLRNREEKIIESAMKKLKY